jgi:hypothetical protein
MEEGESRELGENIVNGLVRDDNKGQTPTGKSERLHGREKGEGRGCLVAVCRASYLNGLLHTTTMLLEQRC